MQGKKKVIPKMMYQFNLDAFVGPENFYRKLSEVLDMRFLYRETAQYYGKDGQRNPPLFWTGCKYTNSDLILLRYSSNGSELCWRATHQG
jgi:hypothetical protein